MKDPSEKAFDFASDATKQLITLSSVIIAVTVTFLTSSASGNRLLLAGAWIAYFLSIVLGVVTLLTMTAVLEPRGEESSPQERISIWARTVRVPSALQILTFLIGVILTVLYGIGAIQ